LDRNRRRIIERAKEVAADSSLRTWPEGVNPPEDVIIEAIEAHLGQWRLDQGERVIALSAYYGFA